jgi:hypothetical protein
MPSSASAFVAWAIGSQQATRLQTGLLGLDRAHCKIVCGYNLYDILQEEYHIPSKRSNYWWFWCMMYLHNLRLVLIIGFGFSVRIIVTDVPVLVAGCPVDCVSVQFDHSDFPGLWNNSYLINKHELETKNKMKKTIHKPIR